MTEKDKWKQFFQDGFSYFCGNFIVQESVQGEGFLDNRLQMFENGILAWAHANFPMKIAFSQKIGPFQSI